MGFVNPSFLFLQDGTRIHDKSLTLSDNESSTFHEYHDILEEKLEENLRFCYEEVTNVWSVAYEDGDLKVRN